MLILHYDGEFEDFRTTTLGSIEEEQRDTLRDLSERDWSPYEKLSRDYLAKEAELESLRERLESLSDEENARINHVRAVAKRAIELAPLAQDSVESLAQEHIASIEHMNRQELEARVAAVEEELADLSELFELAGEAWPMPLAHERRDDSDIIEVDEIPLDPVFREVGPIAQRMIERHGVTNKASAMITEHLVSNPEQIMLSTEIGEAVYTDETHFDGMSEDQRERCISGRVRRLLEPNELVTRMVSEENFVLQRGFRRYLHKDTLKNVQHKRRIYRVVPWEDGVEIPDEFDDQVVMMNDDGSEVETFVPNPDSVSEKETARMEAAIQWLDEHALLPADGTEFSLLQLRAKVASLKQQQRVSGTKEQGPTARYLENLDNVVRTPIDNTRGFSATSLVVLSAYDLRHRGEPTKLVELGDRANQLLAAYFEDQEAARTA